MRLDKEARNQKKEIATACILLTLYRNIYLFNLFILLISGSLLMSPSVQFIRSKWAVLANSATVNNTKYFTQSLCYLKISGFGMQEIIYIDTIASSFSL